MSSIYTTVAEHGNLLRDLSARIAALEGKEVAEGAVTPEPVRRAMAAAAQAHGVTLDEIRTSRQKRACRARHAWAWLLRERLSMSYPEIAHELGLEHHTTAINACRAAWRRRKAVGQPDRMHGDQVCAALEMFEGRGVGE